MAKDLLGSQSDELDQFRCDANEVVNFRLVEQIQEVKEDCARMFHPVMSHQIFGYSETIFGYKDLSVDVVYSGSNLSCLLRICYNAKVSQKCDAKPDDVEDLLKDHLPENYTTNIDEFSKTLVDTKEAKFKPPGDLFHVFTDKNDSTFEIYRGDDSSKDVLEYHSRVQTFLLWFIDGASYIDTSDPNWTYYFLFQKKPLITNGSGPVTSTINGAGSSTNCRYLFVGYMTTYSYYSYPDKTRPRISQVLILPPYQGRSLCVHLLQAFYSSVTTQSSIADITVEDPSENFQRVRDFVDCTNCAKLDCFSPSQLLKGSGFQPIHAQLAIQKFKLNKRQARRVYEILKLKSIDENDEKQVTNYRLEIKKRLYKPFERNGRDVEKLSQALSSNEMTATMANFSTEQKHAYLADEYQSIYEQYRAVIDRLEKAE